MAAHTQLRFFCCLERSIEYILYENDDDNNDEDNNEKGNKISIENATDKKKYQYFIK